MDDTLSNLSSNPVENKVIKAELDKKANKTVATTDTDGLMSAADKAKLDGTDDTYALKSLYGDTTINVGRKAGTTVGEYSTAEGLDTIASGRCCHAEGAGTTAQGVNSHAEGILTIANGNASHAEGQDTVAIGDHSHTSGYYTKALHENEAAYGKYNVSNEDTLFSIGDGTAEDARHNAFEITTTSGKLHDKDIATTEDIPTSLPANGGNANTVNGYKIMTDTITANSDAGGYVWLPGQSRIYISTTIVGHRSYIYRDASVNSTNLYVPDAKSTTLTIYIAWLET